MDLPLYQVDAFTNEVFKGNPAAVCPLEYWPSDTLLQNIAAENNLAETAFFVEENGSYTLRWFTPTVEVALCGHATLATAHVLFEHLNYQEKIIHFSTRESGSLIVTRSNNLIHMDFPIDNITPVKVPEGLQEALATNIEICCKGKTDYLVELSDQEKLDNLNPDFRKLMEIDARGIIITSPGNHYDFVSRFFAPAVGVDEDPVTGSAHTTLVPYWVEKLNKNKLIAQQRSKRSGEVLCELKDERVTLSGNARTYLVGRITIE
ncbi:MAG: PhzF family phenazine biosynthesis protein [Bacteroidota bacterium]